MRIIHADTQVLEPRDPWLNYIVDFCSIDPMRPVAVALISQLDPDFAVAEAIRAMAAGCSAIHLSPDFDSRDGRHLMDPIFDSFKSSRGPRPSLTQTTG